MPEADYHRAAAEVRRRIESGEWPPGHRLPSRRNLAQALGVGEGAIRDAVAVLRQDGYVEGTARARLWVAHPPAVRTLLYPDAEWPHLLGDGGGTGSRLATEELAERLAVPPRTRLRWERLECLDPDSRPSHLVTSWWPGTSRRPWVRSASEAELHHLTAAEAAQLGLAAGLQAWRIVRTRYRPDGRPAETADLVLPADRWRLRL